MASGADGDPVSAHWSHTADRVNFFDIPRRSSTGTLRPGII